MTSVLAAGACPDTLAPTDEQTTREPEGDGLFAAMLAALQEAPPLRGALPSHDAGDRSPEQSGGVALSGLNALSLPADGPPRGVPGAQLVQAPAQAPPGAAGDTATPVPAGQQRDSQPAFSLPMPRGDSTHIALPAAQNHGSAVLSGAAVGASAPGLPQPASQAAPELPPGPLAATPGRNTPVTERRTGTRGLVPTERLVPKVSEPPSAQVPRQPELLDVQDSAADWLPAALPAIQPASAPAPSPHTALVGERTGPPGGSPAETRTARSPASVAAATSGAALAPSTVLHRPLAPRLVPAAAPELTVTEAPQAVATAMVAHTALAPDSPSHAGQSADATLQRAFGPPQGLRRPTEAVPVLLPDPMGSVRGNTVSASGAEYGVTGDSDAWAEAARQASGSEARQAVQQVRGSLKVRASGGAQGLLQDMRAPSASSQRRDRGSSWSVAAAPSPSRRSLEMAEAQTDPVGPALVLSRADDIPPVSELQVEVHQPGAGEVTVRVREHEHQTLAAAVAVDGPVLRQMTQHLESGVRQAMAQEGLSLSSFVLSEHAGGHPSPPSSPRHAGEPPAARRRAARSVESPTSLPGPVTTTDRIDIYA